MPTSVIFQVRRDTTANWVGKTIKSGEIIFDTTANLLKVGNGEVFENTAYLKGGTSEEWELTLSDDTKIIKNVLLDTLKE